MTILPPFRVTCLLSLTALVAACSDSSQQPTGPGNMSTFEVIQHEIFDSNCASCHSSGTAFARQSGLVLTADAAYSQLVGVAPNNRVAAEAGMVRVSNQGLAGVELSYLWEKINALATDHFYDEHPDYGEIMPLGRPPLTNGELEFIRRWIAAGAPETGSVVDVGLLDDDERYEPRPFAPLSTSPGVLQLHLEPFPVVANHEREMYSYMPLDNVEDLYINRFEISVRPGSHHFILYTYPDYTPADVLPEPLQIRDLRDDSGSYFDENGVQYFDWRQMQYAMPIVISQSRQMDFSLPAGVAIRLPPNSGIDVNTHYANASDDAIEGEAFVNLHLLAPDQVEHVAEIFALSNFDILLPGEQVTTLVKEFVFKEDRQVMQLVSHTHERLIDFTAEIVGGARDGELIYQSYDWSHPAPLRFDPPLFMEEGQGLRVRATYDNPEARDIRFGLTREDEMMILYGYYFTE
jgi:hypothetical protein